jgi:A/G-specific adenine glycosylase
MRVLARLLGIRESAYSTNGREKLWNASARLVPRRGAAKFHSALMDLGALICVNRNPRCQVCPVREFCASPGKIVLPRRRPRIVTLNESHEFVRRNRTVLLARCDSRWRGMWRLPPTDNSTAETLYVAMFLFTHHKITLRVVRGPRRDARINERWIPADRLHSIPIPTPHRRAILALLRPEGVASAPRQ